MFIDSHCHLDKLDLSLNQGSLASLLKNCEERDVKRVLSVCVGLDEFDNMYQMIKPFEQVDASLGIHPLHLKTQNHLASVETLVELINKHPKVVAIGETGLDYFYDETTKELQIESFINHLKAGAQLSMPLIIHTRQARQDTLDLIAAYGGSAGGVLHCFTESIEMAQQAIEFNYSISISGIVTFKNSHELKEVVKQLPLEKLLIETDAPYLAPVPYRGKQNQPKYVVEVAQYIADLKGIRVEQLAEITTENYYRLFHKSPSN